MISFRLGNIQVYSDEFSIERPKKSKVSLYKQIPEVKSKVIGCQNAKIILVHGTNDVNGKTQ